LKTFNTPAKVKLFGSPGKAGGLPIIFIGGLFIRAGLVKLFEYNPVFISYVKFPFHTAHFIPSLSFCKSLLPDILYNFWNSKRILYYILLYAYIERHFIGKWKITYIDDFNDYIFLFITGSNGLFFIQINRCNRDMDCGSCRVDWRIFDALNML
jgi:hypothetical protein